MYKPDNWDDIDAISTKRPKEGYYILKIINATEGVSKNSSEPLLRLELDILEGEFANYFTNVGNKINKNLLLRSTQLIERQESLPYFKKLVLDIEASNMGYKFDFEPSTLKSKKIGAYLKSYMYESRYGEKKGLKIDKFISVAEVREELGRQIVEKMESTNTFSNDDLPFD